ncbi:MAG: hypothetical protein OES46_04615 [Gammaproteobacteria bacterium]|jgi:hypothetical protein|nr:hypothetical protein [Gammaproteobacteria bacterium]
MTYDEAKAIAKEHLEANPLGDPYEWTVSDGKLAKEGWYFDYTFRAVRETLEDQQDVRGALGYLVRDSGEVEDLGLEEYEQLRFEPELGL